MNNYHVLFHMLLYATATEDYSRQRQIAQSNKDTAAGSGSAHDLTTADGARVLANAKSTDHVIDTWLGFLGSAKPQNP
eukprot:SAG22_NODE_131_length_18561_cov_10.941387_13_plen_78_part_00